MINKDKDKYNIENIFKIKIISLFLFLFFILNTNITQASIDLNNISYPRLANYFLHWELSDYEAEQLAKWDLIILDMEVSQNSPDKIRIIREINPDIIILAYITSQEIMDDFIYDHLCFLRYDLKKGLDENWYLKDSNGNKLSYWPNTYLLNITNSAPSNSDGLKFNDYLPIFIKNNILNTNLFDGVFFDNVWGDVSWAAGSNIDINNDGISDSQSYIDNLWQEGYLKMIDKAKNIFGNEYIIVGNGRIYWPYQNKLNGMMLEDFPSSWEGNGTWSDSLNNYKKLYTLNNNPQVSIVNSYDNKSDNYSYMRYTLTSALLENGFYSYDYGTSDHGQLWWYDEYNFNLGRAKSSSINTLNSDVSYYSPSLWRRDFENGSVFVNSTNEKKNYIFKGERFSKLDGSQDDKINNGQEINYISLEPNSGIILKRTDFQLKNAIYKNGYFFKYLDGAGNEKKSSGFVFNPLFPGQAELAVIEQNNFNETILSTYKGQIKLEEGGRLMLDFRPFVNFNGDLSLSYSISNGNLEKIAIGAGLGGGPQVMLYDRSGRHERNFFAYDKDLRGGVNVTMFDVDNDGYQEIITGPGPGSEPVIKVFDERGQLINSFLAYDKNFKGGVNVSAGDLNNDGFVEIVTIPASSGGPQVRIFNYEGKILGGFFAFDKNRNGEFVISLSDINNDGNTDIVVGQKNPY